MNRLTSMRMRRRRWVNRLGLTTGSFEDDSANVIAELRAESSDEGSQSILGDYIAN